MQDNEFVQCNVYNLKTQIKLLNDMNEFYIKVIQHDKLVDIDSIIRLKMQHWMYSFESHKKWICTNSYPFDRHILLTKNDRIIGYACLPIINCIIEHDIVVCNGIGSICIDVDEQGMGWGATILKVAKSISKLEKRPLILRCHDLLVSYYINNGFVEYPVENVLVNNKQDDQHLFVYNLDITHDYSLNMDRKF